MEAFSLQEDNFEPHFGHYAPICEELAQNQADNFFGIKFRENMFEEPSAFNPELPKEREGYNIFENTTQQCVSEECVSAPLLTKPAQFPPCRCYRINCQKKYCQCFRNGRKCTKKCICIDCHNQPIVTILKVNVQQFWQVSYMFNNIRRVDS